ncbi:MAG: hypothetical protein ACPHRO_13605 [Nannocystaceae bacterium]
MIRGSYPNHRRYSITHRAVQRLREFVTDEHQYDDETLRDQLDAALVAAEDAGQAVKTLDAMLREPQTLIPIEDFGAKLVSIVKEDTVVTVLPYNHGREIFERGKALQERVESGAPIAPPPVTERFEHRRRWQRDQPETIVIGRGGAQPTVEARGGGRPVTTLSPKPARPESPVAAALYDALEAGRREATRAALSEILREADRDAPLWPLWDELSAHQLPSHLTIGDLIDAVSDVDTEDHD